jgi:flagellar biosynthesis/type III secretory pathway protein FliH
MHYITSAERIGIEKGIKQGLEQGREEARRAQNCEYRAFLNLLVIFVSLEEIW